MKTKDPKFTHLIILITCLLMIFAGCSDTAPVDPDPEPEPNPVNVDENEIVKALRFRNSTIIPGTVPTTVETADLKIDTDTIFWVEGIKNRIKILKPGQSLTFGSFYVQVTGADSYIEAELEIEDETDTIVFLNFDFDITGLQPPFSFNIRIVLLDGSGLAVDEFELPVNIEALTDGDCNFPYDNIWDWIYTVGSNDFFTAPMLPAIQSGTVVGCCSEGTSYYDPICLNPGAADIRRDLNYENIFMVRLEYLKFFESGDVLGEMDQFTQNIRPSESDFCSGSPGYSQRNVHNDVWGTFTFDQGNCSLIIDQLEGLTDNGFPLPFYAGAGPSVEYKLLSSHFLRETRNGEGSLRRIYERRTSLYTWHD